MADGNAATHSKGEGTGEGSEATEPTPSSAGEGNGAGTGEGSPYAVFKSKDALDDRLKRAGRAEIRRLFGMEPEEVQERWSKLQTLEAEREEERKKEMSELERLREQAQTLESAKSKAEQDLEEARFRAHMTALCAQNGVRDVDYFTYKVSQKLNSMGDDETLDEEEFLKELLADKRQRVALGVDDPSQATSQAPTEAPTETKPAQTGPSATPQTEPKPGTTQPQQGEDAYTMSHSDFQKKLQKLGVNLPLPAKG
jgi:hypothetical protein